MKQINFQIKYDKDIKDYKLGFDKDAINQLCQKKEKLIIIPIFGESGCGKSTITTYLISLFSNNPYNPNPQAGNKITSCTRGIDGSIVNYKPSENILILDCEGFGGIDQETEEEEEEDQEKKQKFLKTIVKQLLNISQYSIYVTDQSRLDIQNIEYFVDPEFKIYNKNMYLIFNRLNKEEIIEKEQDVEFIQDQFKSICFIPQQKKLSEKNFDNIKKLFDKEFQTNENIPDQLNNFLKFVNQDCLQHSFIRNYNQNQNKTSNQPERLKNNLQSTNNPVRKTQKLIEIVLNSKNQQYELKLNQDVIESIKTIDQSKKLSVYCFLGKAGQGKSTIANQMIKNISNTQEDVFKVGHSFKSQTQGADCFYQAGENENYLFIDIEGLFGQKSISKDPNLQVSYLLALFNLQALIQIISTTSFLIKKYIRMQQKDIETIKIMNELIQQQLPQNEERPNWNSFFIYNQLNTEEKKTIDNKSYKDIGIIKNIYKDNIFGVSCNQDDDEDDDNEEDITRGNQNNKEKFQKDIFLIQEKAGLVIKHNEQRVNGRDLASKLTYLTKSSNSSIFSLGLFKEQAKQMEQLIQLKSVNDKIMEEVSKKVENGIIEQSKKFLTQEMLGLMINQVNKQKMNFLFQYYKIIQDKIEQSEEEKMILKQINIRKKIVELYFSYNPNKEFQEEYNKIYNRLDLNDGTNHNLIQGNIDIQNQIIKRKLENAEYQLNQYYDKKFDFKEANGPNYKNTEEYYALKQQKRGIEESLENQNNMLQKMGINRFQVAAAGLAGAVAGQLFSNYILGKYKNNKKAMAIDGGIGLTVGGAFSVLTYIKPGAAVGAAAILTLAQTVMTYSNPYRSQNNKHSAFVKSLTEMGTTMMGYAGASYALGLFIANPIGLAFASAALAGSLVAFLSYKQSQNQKKEQQKNILKYLLEQNLQVNQFNINKYYQALQLKDNKFRDIVKNTDFLQKYLPANLISNVKFHEKQLNEQSQMKLYLIYVICIIAMDLDKRQMKEIGEEKFNKNNKKIINLDAFTYYFDFEFISIGEQLYQVANKLKTTYNLTSEKIISKIETIAHKNIDGNNVESQEMVAKKQYLPYQSLLKLTDPNALSENDIPASINKIQSGQKLDLWATYIGIQILKPSYALNSIILKKLNFYLEREGIFFVDYIENFKKIFGDMSSEYTTN